MEWLKSILPLLQTAMKIYLSGQVIKQSQNAKSIALRSGVIGFGTIAFLIFFMASIVMAFVDLGHQFDSPDGVHFSGMMLSALFLFCFGLLVFVICFILIQVLAAQERHKKEIAPVEASAYATLILFGEELLKQLITNLNQKRPPADVES